MKSSVLAYRINVHRSYVSNWLSGKYKANSEKQLEIAKILGVSPAWLAGHDVPMQEQTEKSSASAELSEQVVIYHRDGKNIVKKCSFLIYSLIFTIASVTLVSTNFLVVGRISFLLSVTTKNAPLACA